MTKKLYLINPPNPDNMQGFPGSLLALDLWVRQATDSRRLDVGSTILDESTDEVKVRGLEAALAEQLADSGERPYIGITATTATYQDAIATARAVKRIRPDALVILGGHHVTADQERVILDRHPEFDLLVRGEGEKALEEILAAKTLGARRAILGTRLIPEELNKLTVDKFDKNYLPSATQFEEQNLVTARGCNKTCRFCAVAQVKVAGQTPETVLSQIAYIVEEYAKSDKKATISVQDNFFAQSKGRARNIAALLAEYRQELWIEHGESDPRANFTWNMQTRVEEIYKDPGLVQLFADAGCTAIYMGIENFDPNVLKAMEKTLQAKDSDYITKTVGAITNCLDARIGPHIDLQVGHPVEDAATMAANMTALEIIGALSGGRHIRPLVFPSLSVVYPGTGDYESMRKEYHAPDDIFERYTEWERTDAGRAYRAAIHGCFAHGNGGIPLGILRTGLLKDGIIEVNEEKLTQVIEYVARLGQIPGVTVHDFKKAKRESEQYEAGP